MELLTEWIEECNRIIEYKNADLLSYIKEKEINNRMTLLVLGIYFNDNAHVKVNILLKHFGFNIITHRNRIDAFFMYVYYTVTQLPLSKRISEFQKLANEYFNWVSTNPQNLSSCDKPQNVHPEIVTFGDLYKSLARHSKTTKNSTMITGTRTEREAMQILSECIQHKQSLSDFLSFLNKDEAIQEYNSKATYYIQKMLYQMIKFSVDILYDNHIPEDDVQNNYHETKEFIMLRSSGSAFNIAFFSMTLKKKKVQMPQSH